MNQKNVQSQKQNSVGMELFGEPVQVFFSKKGSARLPRIAHGDGIYLWDKDGNKYLDVSSGPVANNLGSGNKKVQLLRFRVSLKVKQMNAYLIF